MGGRRHQGLYLAFAFALAFCSVAYELILAKTIAEVAGNPTLWESVSMAVFLMGLGLRSLAFTPKDDVRLRQELLWTEAAIPVCSAFGVLAVELLDVLYRIYLYDDGLLREVWPFPPVYLLGTAGQVLSFAIGWLSGFELQFFLHDRSAPPFRRRAAAVLAAYHLGGLAGTLAFLAALGAAAAPATSMLAVAWFNLAVLVLWLALARAGRRAWTLAGASGLALVLAAVCAGPLATLALKNRYYNVFQWSSSSTGEGRFVHPVGPWDLWRHLAPYPEVTRHRTPYQVIDLVPAAGPHARATSLYINGRFQLDTLTSASYHESMVHLALGFAPQAARRILILGGGDGALAYELTKYGEQLAKVTLVDLDAKVIELARSEPFLLAVNHDALAWERLEVVVGDALRYLRGSRESFDAIFVDLTYPYEFDSARFYSTEFFRLLHRRLAADGIFALGSPHDLMTTEHAAWRNIFTATVAAAGFGAQVTYRGRQAHFFVAGKGTLRERPEIPAQLPLETLDRGRLSPDHWRRLPPPERGEAPNSIFAPRFLGVDDTFF